MAAVDEMGILTIYAKIGWAEYWEININQLEAYIFMQSDRLFCVNNLYNKITTVICVMCMRF